MWKNRLRFEGKATSENFFPLLARQLVDSRECRSSFSHAGAFHGQLKLF